MTDRQPPRRVWVLVYENGCIAISFDTRRTARRYRAAYPNEPWRVARYDLHTPEPKPKARGRK